MRTRALFIFLLLVPLYVLGQGPISFGPKIGWNTSKLSTDYSDYINSMQNGVQGGLFFSIYVNKLYVQPEAYFSFRRGVLDTDFGDLAHPDNSLNISQSISLSTIDIPMLIGYRVLDLKLARLRVWGGPVASYILNKSYALSFNGVEQSSELDKHDFKDATWGVQLGAGLDLLMLSFDVGYEFGLEDFATISGLDDFNLRNNTFFVSLGWRLF